MPSALAPSAAHLVCSIALLCVCGCATEPLTATAPKDVDLTGEWQINPGLSDDPAHMQDISPGGSGPTRGRGGRGGRGGGGGPGGSGGGGPLGMPGGAGGPSGGAMGGPELLAASGGSTRAAAGGASGSDPGSFGIGPSNAPGTPNPNGGGTGASAPGPGAPGGPGGPGGGPGGGRRGGAGGSNLLAAPDRMTLEQSGGKLRIQMRLPSGELATEEYTFGAKGTVPIGQDTAERNVGWNGPVLIIETKFKGGPSKEADYALDDSGHLIMTTLVSGGHVRKTELKRVYDRVTAAQR